MPAEAQQASPADGKAAAGSGGQQTTLGKRPAESGAVAPLPSNMALPNAVVQRLIKSKLPDGVMLHKDARAAFNKSTSIFILMLTTIASDISREAKRSTVTGQDVLNALKASERPPSPAGSAAWRERGPP
ncbi:hypothetical protein EMIHUDRAFT_254911, partial [Emiliania huxleyi CCMP1516]|uniref:Transcription factor CBF/NF-Y/archaeal histone domain-containing protein n=2 Tax=Emiliania huxleyi TaxID=2903 RepID=A0A0D3JJD5_EMIH1